MLPIMRYPLFVLVFSLVALWLSARIGVSFRKKRRDAEEAEREDFGVVVKAAWLNRIPIAAWV